MPPASSALKRIFTVGFSLIVLLFACCAFTLIGLAGIELWSAIGPASGQTEYTRFDSVLQCVAMLTIAMASLELADTVVEDEIGDQGRQSESPRIRRVLARFLVVVIVSLAIESLVAVFKLMHDNPVHLGQATLVAISAAALLVGWGLFNRLSRKSERTCDDYDR